MEGDSTALKTPFDSGNGTPSSEVILRACRNPPHGYTKEWGNGDLKMFPAVWLFVLETASHFRHKLVIAGHAGEGNGSYIQNTSMDYIGPGQSLGHP